MSWKCTPEPGRHLGAFPRTCPHGLKGVATTHEFGQTLLSLKTLYFQIPSKYAISVSQTSIVCGMVYSSTVMGNSCLLEKPHGNHEWEKARNVLEPLTHLSKVYF